MVARKRKVITGENMHNVVILSERSESKDLRTIVLRTGL